MPEERGLYPKMKVGAQLSYLAELHGLSKADAHAATERWTERLGIAERVKDTVDSCPSVISNVCSSRPRWFTIQRYSFWTNRFRALTP